MPGSDLSLLWGVPFGGMLLSIALFPVLATSLWHRHYGKIATLWGGACLGSIAYFFGGHTALHELMHVYGQHFLPFIILIGTLYVLSTSIEFTIQGPPTPALNTLILLVAALSANFLGTVGASMIFIKPFLRLNQQRRYKTHSVIFFIFLVCNIGGCLTPIGDPPLFLGFLAGIDFLWPLSHLCIPLLIVGLPLLVLYGVIDMYHAKKEAPFPSSSVSFSLRGWVHIALLALAIGIIVMSGTLRNGPKIEIMGTLFGIVDIIRDISLLGIAATSYKNSKFCSGSVAPFDWHPLKEVTFLFAGIFMTAVPVMAMLKAGEEGPFAWLIQGVSADDGHPLIAPYFWMTGILSSFLDNAPTYLIFYNLVGGDANTMMTTFAPTLTAISTGAVFMGAVTYIGNAPNFMVKSLAEAAAIPMPSFFRYMIWSLTCLGPLFFLLSLWLG